MPVPTREAQMCAQRWVQYDACGLRALIAPVPIWARSSLQQNVQPATLWLGSDTGKGGARLRSAMTCQVLWRWVEREVLSSFNFRELNLHPLLI